jgi:hypothetical protein
VEHQVPQVVSDLNKKEQLVECLVTYLGYPGGTPGSTSSSLSESKGTIGGMLCHNPDYLGGIPASTSSSRYTYKVELNKMAVIFPAAQGEHQVPKVVPYL